MAIADTFATLSHLPMLLKLKKELVPRSLDEIDSVGAVVARNAATYGNQSAFVCEGDSVTWAEFNALANRYAHVLKAQGLKAGDTASVMMENRIHYLAIIIALNKLGVTAGLINTNLTGKPLTHCVTVTESKKCIVGEEKVDAVAEVKAELGLNEGEDYLYVPDGGTTNTPNWAQDLTALAADASSANPDDTDSITLAQTAFYIFTSGTTGLPKAAVMSNRRYLGTAASSALGGLRLKPEHRVYNCLPLYHATGLVVGVGAAFVSGASTFIRRKFSASNFLPEAREHQTTHLIYIGELCRYLVNSDPGPDDANNPLHTMMGNGLRPDVWLDFKSRFGMKRIAELYGASEGNAGFLNLFNKDCTIGTTTVDVRLVSYDVDADEIALDPQGRCTEVPAGEPGLALIQINPDTVFEGYTNPEATEKKVVRNAFAEGDAWFNTGDLLRTIDVGFAFGMTHYQFVDRVGDTFRWKSENVSTNEVGEILNAFDDIEFTNVYGVEVAKADGRAGMAALVLREGVKELNVAAFSAHVAQELPPYARPVFLRVQQDLDVTGTFKLVKGDLRKQAYDLTQVQDPLFVLLPGESQYQRLTEEIVSKINEGNAGF